MTAFWIKKLKALSDKKCPPAPYNAVEVMKLNGFYVVKVKTLETLHAEFKNADDFPKYKIEAYLSNGPNVADVLFALDKAFPECFWTKI